MTYGGATYGGAPYAGGSVVVALTPPTGLVVTPGVTSLALTWSAVTGADGYEVRIDGGAATDVGNVLGVNFTGLTPGSSHTVEVRAYRSASVTAWASIDGECDPVPAPTGLAVTVGIDSLTLEWDAITPTADGYKVRIDGGAAVDTDGELSYLFPALAPESTHTLEVRAYISGVFSPWSSIISATDVPPAASLALDFGPDDDPVGAFGSVVSITITRGLSADGVTEQLEPGVATIVLRDDDLNPLTNPNTRPGQRVRIGVEALVEDSTVSLPLFTGTIRKAKLLVEKDDQTRLVLTATDAVENLTATPYTEAHAGTFAQRVTPILEAAGVAYEVHDAEPEDTPGTLPTDQKTALAQLVLARDTTHGFVYVDRYNVVQAFADRERSHAPATAVLTDGSVAGLDYIGIDPGFDTEDLVNVLTVETLTGGDPLSETFADEDSVAEWGASPQAITVNDGDAATHALRFLARLDQPSVGIREVTLNVTKIDAFYLAAQLELYQAVRVVRAGLVDQDRQIIHLEHSITPQVYKSPKWLATITTRKREVLPARWRDIPPDMTWDDVPPDMTWDDAVTWHP